MLMMTFAGVGFSTLSTTSLLSFGGVST